MAEQLRVRKSCQISVRHLLLLHKERGHNPSNSGGKGKEETLAHKVIKCGTGVSLVFRLYSYVGAVYYSVSEQVFLTVCYMFAGKEPLFKFPMVIQPLIVLYEIM